MTEVAELLDPGLVSVVTGKGSPHPSEILLALRDQLDDVLAAGEWGFATAPVPLRRIPGWLSWCKGGQPAELFPVRWWYPFLLKIINRSWVIVQIDGHDPSVLTDLPG